MQKKKEQQQFFMQSAIALGEKGRQSAPPNPWVGAVIVQHDQIVGVGYHLAPGSPHAEIVALNQAGALAKGATLYITLEPCSHVEKKTPPCIDAIIKAGIKQVVIPFLDPDPHVNGKGVLALKKAGIEVEIGVCSVEAEKSLAPYLFQRKNNRPYCVLKTAMSLDGKIAAIDGSSQWITGEKARSNVHVLRAESSAILVGTQTALLDNPSLTIRHIEPPLGKQPLRVVLDAKGKLRGNKSLLDTKLAPTLIFTSSECTEEALKEWKEKGIEVESVPLKNGKLNLQTILNRLNEKKIVQLLVEGGSHLQTSFIEDNFANQITFYIGPCLLGEGGKGVLNLPGSLNILNAKRLFLQNVERFEDDMRLDYSFSL